MSKLGRCACAFVVASLYITDEVNPIRSMEDTLLQAGGVLEQDGRRFCNAVLLRSGEIRTSYHCAQPDYTDVQFVQSSNSEDSEDGFSRIFIGEEINIPYIEFENKPDDVYLRRMVSNDRMGLYLDPETLVHLEPQSNGVSIVNSADSLVWFDHLEVPDIQQTTIINGRLRPYFFGHGYLYQQEECDMYRHKETPNVLLTNCNIKSGDSGSGFYGLVGDFGYQLVGLASGLFDLRFYAERDDFWQPYVDLLGPDQSVISIVTPAYEMNRNIDHSSCVQVISNNGLNIRIAPNADAPRHGSALPFNEIVEVLNRYNHEWIAVETSDLRQGYVSNTYVQEAVCPR
jgi:hypothetical protein